MYTMQCMVYIENGPISFFLVICLQIGKNSWEKSLEIKYPYLRDHLRKKCPQFEEYIPLIICPLFQICPLLLSIYFNLSIFLSIFSKKCWLFNFLAVFHFFILEFPLFKKIQNIFIKLSKVILKSYVTFKLLIQSSSVLSFWRPQNVKLRIG